MLLFRFVHAAIGFSEQLLGCGSIGGEVDRAATERDQLLAA